MAGHGTLVRLERRTDGVALITIDHPPVNALTRPVFAELNAVTDELRTAPPGAVVITGRPKVFALGGEISETYRTRFQNRTDVSDAELDAAVREITDPDYVRELGEKYLVTFDAIAALPCMVIAAISGIAFGGGLELALACDYRIASQRAKLATPEIILGGTSIGGGVYRLPRLVGPAMAKRMYLGGEAITAAEALRIGLVNEVMPAQETVPRALAFAQTFVPYAGPSQAWFKELIDAGHSVSGTEANQLELRRWCESYATEDARGRLRDFLAHGPRTPL
ncbi:putative enoyl-CoA hydratase [Frankia canadensis]|uniref:Putative enoyl-CoA hydratase n=1 Tax=Frankia canadensis TaxID=1836972 RepID=A0A2I2KX61_9ACTN|nr:enoyl-CoA hydratase/isomerase family protein [Frankia canadensis]SNQ50255.1 putative enoyl-CoA hydratase [Frankia canadensis]SOU57545.1 putative enoyl-CoA hydratase [Frankia canadensis]